MKILRLGFAGVGMAGLILTSGASATTRYVDLNCTNASTPFTDWTTAATNIQDAIDASVDADLILVTNGVYATGGRVMAGDLTNRVALNKALTVQSVNGPFATVIQGAGATNGTSAVRCAWLTNGASLVGFTLQAGATRLLRRHQPGLRWRRVVFFIQCHCGQLPHRVKYRLFLRGRRLPRNAQQLPCQRQRATWLAAMAPRTTAT